MPDLRFNASADRIRVAEAIIDEIVENWDRRRPVTEWQIKADVRALFATRHQLQWFQETFSEKGWEVLIKARLVELGFKRFAWGWGGRPGR